MRTNFPLRKHRFNIFPEMNEEDFGRLKSDIILNGFDDKNPIWLYEGEILDGWNRYNACYDLSVVACYADFEGDADDAIGFVMRSNKRRNLTSSQWACIAVDTEDIVNKLEEEAKARMLAGAKDPGQQIAQGRVREQLADLFNTNKTYISDAKKFKEESPETFEQVKRGEKTITEAKKKAHVSNNSGECEWYTPPQYIESARLVMGKIDLDPASSEIANKQIKANKYFDESTDGLTKKWFGNIWMNPPYANELMMGFISKLESETYEQAIVLVNNATETKWGQKLLHLSNAVCFHTGRIRFITPDGEVKDAPLQGQMIIYIGKNYKLFIDEFKKYGVCLRKGI